MKKILLVISLAALLLIAACDFNDSENETAPLNNVTIPDNITMPTINTSNLNNTSSPIDGGNVTDVNTDNITEELPAVVASVNEEEILRDELIELQTQMQIQGVQITTEEALDQLISREILIQEAQRQGYEVTTQDVEDRFVMQGFSVEEVRTIIEAQGLNYEEFLEEQKRELKLTILAEEKMENITITDEEAQIFYNNQTELENFTFEELREDIKYFLAEQQVNQELLELAEELRPQADVRVFI